MGCHISSTFNSSTVIRVEDAKNSEIDLELRREKIERRSLVKMILLGAAEGGKSTIFKQIRIIHTEGFSDEELMSKRTHVIANAFESMMTILVAMRGMNLQFEDDQLKNDAATVEQIVYFCKQTVDGTMDETIAESIKRLWTHQKIQEVYDRRSEYHLPDCAKYFLDDIDRISAKNYKPTVADMLRCRVQTTGVVELSFTWKKMKFSVIDVGGQRSERRKWIHHFDDCKGVIFVCALSEYDEVCAEDDRTNRMKESLILFENICLNSFFTESAFILFLNKRDLFEEKILRVPLTVCFSTFPGPQNYENCYNYIESRFIAAKKHETSKIYPHATCATDTNQVQLILHSVIDMLIQQSLKSINLT